MAYDRTIIARRITLAKATSAIALATGLALGASGPAIAQSSGAFEGNPTVVSGSVSINRSPGTDNIQIDTDQAVINWTTNDTALTGPPINFLPSGRTAFFRNNPSAQNFFTVLNRIIPTGTGRSVQLNGTVISQLQTASGLVSGGNVWFYSPGGIVVNSTAVIDVGGLLLTSSDPVRDGAGNFINASGAFTLGPSASASSVIVQPGAQIRATPENSYVAMIAPTVLQAGNVNVNGSALYVGAEAATITFGGNGLFDIQVTTGTNGTGGVAVGHGGVTTGPASTGAGDNHRIYMVAVPKNNAITLALSGGSLGFDVAGAANVVGNSIILSAGYDVFGDFIDTSAPVNPGQQANISIASGAVTSAINAAASFNSNVSVGSGTLSMASDARFYGNNQSTVTAFGTGSILVGGDLTVSSDRFAQSEGQNVVGGNAQLYAQAGGSIVVNGSAFVTANGFGGGSSASGAVGSGTGGLADVRSFGNSLLQIGGDLIVSADGFAGEGETGAGSNAGIGGTVIIASGRNATVDNNSTMLVNGDLFATANGYGSSNFGAGVAGLGRGGSIQIESGSSTGIASSNNVMTINGSILSSADGFGGSAFNDGIGGAGIGGLSSINAGVGGRVNVAGQVAVTSFGFGGNADDGAGNGGAGSGGSSFVQIFGSGGVLNFGSDLLLQATGVGGRSGFGATALGGLGTGGQAQIALSSIQTGGAITVQGLTKLDALGIGGEGTTGGNGQGGTQGSSGGAYITANGAGNIALNGGVQMSSGGIGGAAVEAGIGGSGNGTGGSTQIVAAAAGANINITGLVNIDANGTVFGSALTGIDGGNGTGGNASISQSSGGAITITGDALVQALGIGAANYGGGDGIAGNGTGGDARIAVNDLAITITGKATVDASGFGGANLGGIRGGNGVGGLANLGAAVGTLAIGGDGVVRASGLGGDSFTPGSGGTGTGGQALIGTVTSTALIQIAGLVDVTANGEGGDGSGSTGAGGSATGGTAQLFAQSGRVNVTGTSFLSASAFGGNGIANAAGGAAQGGNASIISLGDGQIALGDSAFLAAFAGAGSSAGGSGNTGTATGGNATIQAQSAGSSVTVNGSFFADASAIGGSSGTGLIGLATGGVASATAQSGLLQINGNVTLDGSATGGDSTFSGIGGAATGGRTLMVVFGSGGGTASATGSMIQRVNGIGGNANVGAGGVGTGGLAEFGTLGVVGTVTVGGDAELLANGFGGTAFVAGNGGDGIGGEARAGVNGATLRGGNIILGAGGFGGNATAGGSGGNGTGGIASLIAGSGPVTGLVDFDSVLIDVSGIGGMGGAGTSGATGGAGGNGGTGTGGSALLLGSAGNGQLDVLGVQMFADGIGGAGGRGGTGSAGLGGNGGSGGAGNGGVVQFGTQSGTAALTVNVGFADTGNILAAAQGFGGSGGDGGLGSSGVGNGGNGGHGFGGLSLLTVRGSRLTAGDITMAVGGAGGFGGSGGVLGGTGGNGTGGGLGFAITDRFQIPANRGLLQAGNILGIATGIGGAGAVSGLGYYSTGNTIELRNADASVGSFVINISGDLPDPLLQREDSIRITDGTFNAGTSFTYLTPNALSVLIGNASLNADAVGLSAGTFVADTVIAPTNLGTITTNALGLFSNNDLIVSANLNVAQDIAIAVPGTVTLGNIVGGGVIGVTASNLTLGNLVSGNHINLTSTSGAITAGSLFASNFIAMTAANGLTLGIAQTATGYIDLLVLSGDMNVGTLSAGGYLALETAAGNITAGDLNAGQDIGIEAIGSVTFGNATAGLDLGVLALGNITGGNIITQGALPGSFFGAGLISGGNIALGSIQSARNIGMIGLGTLTTGALSTGESVVLLVDGDIQINGGVTTGTGIGRNFYIGNSSMSALLDGGGFGNTGGNTSFVGGDPAPIFASNPVRTLGSLTVNGPIQTYNFVAGLGTGFTAGGPITAAGGRVAITATSIAAQAINSTLGTALNATNGSITAGNITAGGAITMAANAGGLNFGTLSSGANTQLLATGSVIGGDITSGSSIGTVVGGNLTLGNLRTTGPGVATSGFGISMGAAGAITTGTIDSFGSVVFGLDDGQGIVANALSITSGAITAGGGVLLRSTEGLATGAISSTADIRVRGGNVTLGALNAGTAVLAAATTGSLTTGNITAGTSALLLAGQSVSTGSITTGATGVTLITNSSAISSTGLVSIIDLDALMAGTPSPVGGSVSIGGPVVTGTLQSASSGSFSASGAITAASRITINTGGTAVFGGLAAAPTIAISSGDIAFSQGGGLGNASTGTLTLTANRSGPVIIGGSGDSQGSSGAYTLDGSEIARIRAQNIVINAPNVSSSGTGVEIRALTMNGSAAASGVNLNGSEGSLTINTGGTIRVNGNAIFNAMAPTNRVALNAGRVEINADTGGIFLNGSSPGGVLSITANNIHIAGASLLERLAENVNFTGRDTALGVPIATSRPDGVIQASRLQFNVGNTLLIQNTGTSLLNAGFFGRVGSIEIAPRSSQSASGGIDMVIYGQLLDTGDIVRTGSSVRDLIFPTSGSAGQDSGGPSGFTANSSVNGCLLNAVGCGSGGITQESPTVVTHAGPPPQQSSEERQAEREQEEAEAAAEQAARGETAPRRPIMPPVTIVNTRRLGVEPIIDEPVTSGGNPNLQLDQPITGIAPETGGQP
ncbi:beta strand repeat-containing protein [Blastomonas sp.]|uniref:beta strand repeat-containing protein n=1 Tax=Blastomonas sp. TaxID=1909299 RepID=UPI00391CF0D4